MSKPVERVLKLDHALWFGKMSPVPSPSTEEKISQRCLKKPSGSLNQKPPIFMYLQKDGQWQDATWETLGQSLGESSTLSIGESPKEDVESRLSQILEGNPPPQILFKPESSTGHFEQSRKEGQTVTGNTEEGTNESGERIVSVYDGARYHNYQPDVTRTLTTVYENHSQDSRFKELGDVSQPVTANYGMGGNNQPLVVSETAGTLDASYCSGISCNMNNVVRTGYIVRRLTPLECERLQGYPDGWTDIGEWTDSKGKKRITSDSARYKALGNSIAIPPWLWVCSQMGKHLGNDHTMASLFDGIGGFPLIWTYLYGDNTVRWASEIEEFPIAVTKYRFIDNKEDLMSRCLALLEGGMTDA